MTKQEMHVKYATGQWLQIERTRLSLTRSAVARQLRVKPVTVWNVEDRNKIIPPGWFQGLSALDFTIPEHPCFIPPVPDGHWLAAETERLHHTKSYVSNQLGTDYQAEFCGVYGKEALVPADWLPKLTELQFRWEGREELMAQVQLGEAARDRDIDLETGERPQAEHASIDEQMHAFEQSLADLKREHLEFLTELATAQRAMFAEQRARLRAMRPAGAASIDWTPVSLAVVELLRAVSVALIQRRGDPSRAAGGARGQ